VDRIAPVVVESAARRVFVDGRSLDLTTVEYEILTRLVRSAGSIVARERLVVEVFEREFNQEDRALDVHISRLRKKLGPDASLIVTVRGAGHMLRTTCAASQASRVG
jgi:DNA-binding response OmpR family regulator